ncbi:Protein SlyX [Pelagimonas phthalicica]|uniref:Protein SlyX n=1 Tax=Pelagimonas phthalicica TaxID=1037362 RepID=A0A238JHA5_9RHOB|nr:SlyX family protein [Pelagimonas phthalicica]TDS89883.1 SlyX protein [Pelagimonas phthalicica]SMX30050.1 Protein SlyX [Pelagimonas phthalicica]
MTDTTHLEERIAHLLRVVDDLSDTVVRQDKELKVLSDRVLMLMQREAEREAEGGGGIVIGDERPPHW